MAKYSYLLLVIPILLFLGCSSNTDKDNYPIVKGEASYPSYLTFEELYRAASDIIEIKVLEDQQVIIEHDVPFTISKVEIESVWKGELLHQNVISIAETGGVYNPHLYGDETEKKQAETVELAMEGVRVMQPGEQYMLFVKYNDLIKEENTYYTLGIYQGKYRINGDQVERGASIGAEEKRFTFDSLDSLRAAVQKLKAE